MATILLVEDNEMNRDMLTRRLQRTGHQVLIATNGQEGLDTARQARPDVVLMDMSLPVLDGWEASRRMKSDPDLGVIPIIALTAHAMAEDRQKAIDAGCDDYQTKPIDFPMLMEKIERFLKPAA
ncbi:MAG: response regulator [Anaerolineae bacterium]|nr:MAG: response regulator [Anaerolineae bacterium]